MERNVTPSRICVVCQRDLSDEAKFCPHCGHSYVAPSSVEIGERVGSVLPVIGGLSILVAGLISVGNGVYTVAEANPIHTVFDGRAALYLLGGLAMIASGIIGMIAGNMAMHGKNLIFSLAGGFAALSTIGLAAFSVGLSIFYASNLALIGILLIAISHQEFET